MPFEAAPFGVIGLETAFSVLYTNLVVPGLLTLETAARAPLGRAGGDLRARPPAHRGRRAGEPDAHRHRRRPGRVQPPAVPVALDQLVAHRRAAREPHPADDRRRTNGVRAMTGFLVLEDGTVFAGESVAAPRSCVRRGRLHDCDERLPGDGRPTRATPARSSASRRRWSGNYGVADERSQSGRIHATAVVMREARGPEWTDWLQRARHRRADRHRHALARPAPARPGSDARGSRRRRGTTADEALAAVARSAGDGGRRARRGRLAVGPVHVRRRRRGARRGRRLRHQAVAAAPRRLARCGSRRLPARRRRRHARRATTACCSATGPGDPAPLDGEVATVRELLGRTPVLGVCLGHQLLALATGRTTFKLPFGHRGANHPVLDHRTGRVLVTSQNHGFAVAAGDGAGDNAHLALRRHGRGPRRSRSCARSRRSSTPKRAQARTTGPRSSASWVEELKARCLEEPTSSRSA